MTAVPIDHSHRRRRPEPLDRRTGDRVRRFSQAAGREDWKAMSFKEGRRILLALRIHAEKQRRKGERTGCAPRNKTDKGGISFGAVRLAEALVNLAVKHRGRVEPSAKGLGRMLNVPAKSIHVWKEQLRRHGFLGWRRRWIFTGRQGVRGPQVEQTSNAYWLKAPLEALEAADRASPNRPPPPTREEKLAALSPTLRATLEQYDRAAADRAFRNDPT